MKTLLISLVCCGASMTLFAQTDTTNAMNNGTNNPTYNDTTGTMHNNNPVYTDTAGTMNNNMNSNMNSTTDTSAYMNNNNPTTNTYSANSAMNSNTNGNWNNGMANGSANVTAALPVKETYVPEDIVEQAKQKFPNGQIYDITAVRSPEDTVNQNSMAMTNSWDSTRNNTAMDPDHDNDHDTTMALNNATANQNNYNNNTTANNYNNNMSSNNMEANSQAPEKYDYVVRVLQNGQMTTETLKSDGTALVQRTSNGQLTSQ